MNLVPFQCYYAIDISLRFITDSSFFTPKTLAFFSLRHCDIVSLFDIFGPDSSTATFVPWPPLRWKVGPRNLKQKIRGRNALVYLDSINGTFGTLLAFMKVYE